ncbi:hypothetical protein K435DRAFT_448676 [Dendrothele bispora CBS 962.96]|uniref:Secreted protein n=1 Tax=Dendrothele bispora (strain CBS 962.96) TaxID=1314807 RepID=A0A4S8L209_DENBC|nr:hypothetical protein K435DRAFT_448676 [Dendrothele bispora CBS 962.96]
MLFFLLLLVFSLSLRILVNNTVTTFFPVSSSTLSSMRSHPVPSLCVYHSFFFRSNHVAYIYQSFKNVFLFLFCIRSLTFFSWGHSKNSGSNIFFLLVERTCF